MAVQMSRPPRRSSLIKRTGYDAAARELHIKFESGDTYVWTAVPPELHAGLLGASSHGVYFNENIKGKFPQYKIEKK
jgi:hypothetical protein